MSPEYAQSVKTTESGGPRGFDAGKMIKGRKRHIVTDTNEFLVGLVVHAANIQGNQPIKAALTPDFAPRMSGSVRFQWSGILLARPAGFGFP